jgi:hypothetical protein
MSQPAGLRRFVRQPGSGAAGTGLVSPAGGPAARPDEGPGLPAAPAAAAVPALPADDQAEKCEMCSARIGAEHGHIADLDNSSLACACRACYLLFTQARAVRGRYRSVPDRYLTDSARPLTGAEWEQFDIPVGLAFFLRSSRRDEVAGFYPSPAGATECILDLAAWDRLTAGHPLLAAAEPDVEAALICRGDSGVECFLVPVDACYELAGRMRLLWRGFDGGEEARRSIDEFLAGVRARARQLTASPAADPRHTPREPETAGG